MRVAVVTPPAAVVTAAEARARLRIEGDDENSLLDAFIATATQALDGPAGWLGRAIGVQTLDAWFDNFGAGQFALPFPPVIELVEVAYRSPSTGAEVTVPADHYEAIGDRIASAYGFTWPAPRWQREAVRVRYQAGYETVPDPIKTAILLMVGDLYRNRETPAPTTLSAVPMSMTVESLLAPYRVYS